jgi:hypothetical protein
MIVVGGVGGWSSLFSERSMINFGGGDGGRRRCLVSS